MIYHVLNGDGLAQDFDIKGEIVVCRECLIEGDLTANNLEEFWKVRADFIKKTFGEDDYFTKVKREFDKLKNLNSDDEVNLWFGNEAFCQVNLWFVVSLMADKEAKIYRVFPDSEGWNCVFQDLENCFKNRQILTEEDIEKITNLWKPFVSGNFQLPGEIDFENFPGLKEVCQAVSEKDTKPKEILREITSNGETDFSKIFFQFQQKAGIYGYGDSQVRNLLIS